MNIFQISIALFCLALMGKSDANPLENKTFLVGFSQATTIEPWRLLFNQQLREEAAKHSNIILTIEDGMDDADKQLIDVKNFIDRPVDILLISPKVSNYLTPIVNQAFEKGIPVFVLDRDLANEKYTQFIGGDNYLIGKTAGEYAIKLLGGRGKAKGNIVEIWGINESSAARDRHKGFHEVLDKEPEIYFLLQKNDGQFKQHLGYEIMINALDKYPKIDLVYAHNDPMAYGAHLAAEELGREKEILFLGIDGIPAEGVRWVHEGILTATFLYETPGREVIQQLQKLLHGESLAKRISLPTQIIDKSNASLILKNNNLLP